MVSYDDVERLLDYGRESRHMMVSYDDVERLLNVAGRQKNWSASSKVAGRQKNWSASLKVAGRQKIWSASLNVNQLASSKSNDSTEPDLGSLPWYASLSGSSE